MSASIFMSPLWAWLAIAAGLLAIEVATGSGYLLWASAAAGIVGLLHGFGVRLGWGEEVVVFAVLSIGGALISRRLRPPRTFAPGDVLNDPDARLIGREGRAVIDFRDAQGRVFVEGKEWAADAAEAAPLPAGARIEVLDVIGGSRLKVRPVG